MTSLDRIHIELKDALGTTIAAGYIPVDNDVLTPALSVAYDGDGNMLTRELPAAKTRLADVPFLPALLAGDGKFRQDAPLNPALFFTIKLRLEEA